MRIIVASLMEELCAEKPRYPDPNSSTLLSGSLSSIVARLRASSSPSKDCEKVCNVTKSV